MAQDFMTKLQSFMSMDPKELVKKYPNVDPNKLLDQLQVGKMGLQSQGQQFAGGPTPDQGLLQGVPGAMPQGGQGFQANAPSPWTPQPTAEQPFGDVAQGPGFKISEMGAMGAPAAGGGINPAMLASLMGGMQKGMQPEPFRPAAPVTGAVRPPGGANAKLTIQMPGLQSMTDQMLQDLLKRSVYG